ncbi:MAG: methionyl-tRNA formyltransferase [Thermoleophilaceae bacterium]|nr:methionyl-tRNA formyltransferase [Thermoleophilaceae bacterium]
MRTVFLGTSEFAVGVLERLARSAHRPSLVVTRPDRPRGRGRRLASPPVADAARLLGIPVYQPESVNSPEAIAAIADARPDTVCICAFGALIEEPLLSAHPMLNVHPSLLPRWRGAAPIERAIDAGDEVTGVSIMVPVAEMDAGPVCLQRKEPIRPDDDYGSLSRRLREVGGELLVRALDERPECRPQPDTGVTIAPRIEPSDRRLDPGRAPADLERRVRALTPHVGAYVELPGGERLGVRRAAAAELQAAADGAPGELVASGERLFLRCAGGALELLVVQPAGGRAMDAAAYVRGHSGKLSRVA